MTQKPLFFSLALTLTASVAITAQPVPHSTTISQKAKSTPQLFAFQRTKSDLFLLIPDSLLGRPFLSVTRFITTPSGLKMYGGELGNTQVLCWEKKEDKLVLRSLDYGVTAESGSTIARAVRNSGEQAIVAAIPIESPKTAPTDSIAFKDKDKKKRKKKNKHNEAFQERPIVVKEHGPKVYRIKATDLFKGDHASLSISATNKAVLGATSFKADQSFIDEVRAYPTNLEVSSTKTYAGRNATAGNLTFQVNTSWVLLPKEPMRPRTFDPRVGYFTERATTYNDTQQSVRPRQLISRWRLEPKEEDLDKMRRGELVEPKKPIIYYVDPATPRQWVKYLIQGVEDWNVAFEQAGFKNAIRAYEWPNDSTMSTEDARYSVIRYLASPTANAYGPRISDPRSGEILESHIGWYHNVMKLVHDWYMIQAGAVDERTHTMHFDEKLMGELIRFVSSHEVGHTLGLRHNMGASYSTPVEKLRSKEWVEKHGHTASIMDYARFNYVAQPEDNIGEAGIFPRINDYDKWAIEWGYKYFPDAQSENEERLLLNRITIDSLTANPRLWFGGEGKDNDPRAQTEDLGDDAMKASDYGLRNLRRIVPQLDKWSYEEGDLDDNLKQVYGAAITQYRRYVGHVCHNVGGQLQNFKSAEQPGAVYEEMSRERQRRALQWVNDNVVKEPQWLIAPAYVKRIHRNPQDAIRPAGENMVSYLTSTNMFNNVAKQTHYTANEYIHDLLNMLFPITGKSSSWLRFLQQTATVKLLKQWSSTTEGDGRPYMTAFLQQLLSRLRTLPTTDTATRAHYADLRLQIQQALNGGATSASRTKAGT